MHEQINIFIICVLIKIAIQSNSINVDWSVGLSIRGAWLIALESLIRPDMIASKQILLAYAFPNYGIHDRLGSHRCCPELDFCKGLSQRLLSFYMCFYLLSSGRVS